MDILNRINDYFDTITSVGHIETTELDEFSKGILADYRKFWKKLDDEQSITEEISYNEHLMIIKTISNIEDIVSDFGHGVTLYTEDSIKDHVEESMRDNFYELIDNVESGSWPYSYVEFDMDSAINEAVESANLYEINNVVLYQKVDIYSIY